MSQAAGIWRETHSGRKFASWQRPRDPTGPSECLVFLLSNGFWRLQSCGKQPICRRSGSTKGLDLKLKLSNSEEGRSRARGVGVRGNSSSDSVDPGLLGKVPRGVLSKDSCERWRERDGYGCAVLTTFVDPLSRQSHNRTTMQLTRSREIVNHVSIIHWSRDMIM